MEETKTNKKIIQLQAIILTQLGPGEMLKDQINLWYD